MAARILLVAALLALSACASVEVGRKFDLATFDSRVQRGVTTRAEVEAIRGVDVDSVRDRNTLFL